MDEADVRAKAAELGVVRWGHDEALEMERVNRRQWRLGLAVAVGHEAWCATAVPHLFPWDCSMAAGLVMARGELIHVSVDELSDLDVAAMRRLDVAEAFRRGWRAWGGPRAEGVTSLQHGVECIQRPRTCSASGA